MRAAVAHPVGVERVGEWGGLMVVVVGGGVRVVVGTVRFSAVAELGGAAARLGPTGLGVVERGGASHGLTGDRSGGCDDVCVREYEAVSIFTQEPVRTV